METVNNPFSGQKPSSSLATLLASISFRKEGQYFLNQTIYIDDYTFVRCRFDRCILVTNRGTFMFIECVISNDTIISYGGEALKITKLFNSMTQYGHLYPNFIVKLNPNGTFTLQ